MDQILQTVLEFVREQQRDAPSLDDTMTKAEVVELTMSMMKQQGIDEYHEDLEADIYERIQYLAPRLFEHEKQKEEITEITQEKFNYRTRPAQEMLDSNENLALDVMIGDELQDLETPVELDTIALEYEQAYEDSKPRVKAEAIPNASAIEDIAVSSPNIDEATLNELVLAKYRELAASNGSDFDIDSANLATLVMQALNNSSSKTAAMPESEDVDSLLKEVWESDMSSPTTSTAAKSSPAKDSYENQADISKPLPSDSQEPASLAEEFTIYQNEALTSSLETTDEPTLLEPAQYKDEKADILSFYSTKSYLNTFLDYLESGNKKVDTGISSIDRILETGLHSGLYLLQADSIDLNALCLQIADNIAASQIDVCCLLFQHFRYECMAKSISRLTYELRGRDRENAICLSELYKNPSPPKPELSYYQKNIAPHLYFSEENFSDMTNLLFELQTLLNTLERQHGQKPVFILDDISYYINSKLPLADLAAFCSKNDIILLAACYDTKYYDAKHCSFISFDFAQLPAQDSFTKREILLETGEALTIDVTLREKKIKKKCQILSVPKFYEFHSR